MFKSYPQTASHHTCHSTCLHWNSCKFLSHFHFVENSSWPSYCTFFCTNFETLCARYFSFAGSALLTSVFSTEYAHRSVLWLYGRYNAQGAFAIIFFICRDLLKYLRSLYSHYIVIIKHILQPNMVITT